MIHAKLHTGQTLEFPPETPPEVVDAVVQQHIAEAQPQPAPYELEFQMREDQRANSRNDLLAALVEAISILGQLSAESRVEMGGLVEQLARLENTLVGHAHLVSNTIGTLAQGAPAVASAVSALAERVANVENGVSQVSTGVAALSGEVSGAADRVVSALMAPKSIVTDANGRPVGVQINQPLRRSSP